MNSISGLSSDVHCRACDGTGIFVPFELLELERDIALVLEDFPPADIMGKGQWFFKPRTIIRTLAYMYLKGDIEGRRIACLGAPTLAVGLGILKDKAHLNIEVTLLDIDVDILDVVTQHFDFVDIHRYNISDNCPIELQDKFDVFLFDPLYSEDHYKIGLSRCVQLVGSHHPDKVGYLVVPPEEIAPIRTFRKGTNVPIQLAVFGLLNEMGLFVADFKDNFMEYTTPLAEAGILRRRTGAAVIGELAGEWRGSDLVRVVSTASTQPAIEGSANLEKRVNNRRRAGPTGSFVPLDEGISDGSICQVCTPCFSSHVEDQRHQSYAGYWKPELMTRVMHSWRAEDDQPFEVAPSCTAFENTRTGEIVILRGPAAKAIWKTLCDIEDSFKDSIDVESLVNRSLPDCRDLDHNEVLQATADFLRDLMKTGLCQSREIAYNAWGQS